MPNFVSSVVGLMTISSCLSPDLGVGSIISRNRRQDDDAAISNIIRHRQTEVGVHIDDHCSKRCSDVLVKLVCNMTTGRCQCQSEFPVNIDQILCVKGSKLEGDCKYNGECKYFDENAICKDNTCVCSKYYNQVRSNGTVFCQRASSVLMVGSVGWILFVVIASLTSFIALVALFCVISRLYNRKRLNSARTHFVGNGNASSNVFSESGTRRGSDLSIKSQTSFDGNNKIRRSVRDIYASPTSESAVFSKEGDFYGKRQENSLPEVNQCKCQHHRQQNRHHLNNHRHNHNHHHHHDYM